MAIKSTPVKKDEFVMKHLEIKSYRYNDISIKVKIDFEDGTISLIEKDAPKQWVFAKRELEYMEGWRQILAAMENAINHAEKELTDYQNAIQTRMMETVDKAVVAINKLHAKK